MQPVQAHVVDSNHLELMQPIQLSPGSNVMILIVQPELLHENQAWYQLSTQGLANAYGDNEPEYSTDLITNRNQDYEP